MVTIGMNYNVIEGKQSEFEAKGRNVIQALNAAEHHVASQIYRDIDDGCSFLIVSEWDSQEAFTAFIRSDAFREVTDWGKAEILAGRPRHKVYKH